MEQKNFNNLPIAEPLQEVLTQMGITSPTPIQALAIPMIAKGGGVVVRSQTGGGKTLAYLLPIISRMSRGERALVLAPTRELAQQIGALTQRCCEAMGLRSVTIVGGVEYEPQRVALGAEPEVVVATVGRLVDLVVQGVARLDGVDFFVLDEVDQMLDLGFRESLVRLASFRVEGAQSVAISATMPEGVVDALGELISNYQLVEVEGERAAVERIEQRGYYVEFAMMDALLIHLLGVESPERSILFTRSRKMADRLSKLLCERGFASEAMHSERSQTAREHILERFRGGETKVLVATDIVARGIDVEGVDYIFNYGLPLDVEQYIHRIGRTARGGESGVAITLSPPDDCELVSETCRFMRQNIPMSTIHPYATPAVVKSLTAPKKGAKKSPKNRARR
ncbi:MAG: DEAD/DEAH box helicase [Rikenellaceae bacterium]